MFKCSECGFLTLRDRISGQLVEVIDDYRVSGKRPEFANYDIHNYPICFVMAYDLMPEVEEAALEQALADSDDWGKYVVGVIQKPRECPPNKKVLGFTKYYQGFTPKEHWEMIDRKRQTNQGWARTILTAAVSIVAVVLAWYLASSLR